MGGPCRGRGHNHPDVIDTCRFTRRVWKPMSSDLFRMATQDRKQTGQIEDEASMQGLTGWILLISVRPVGR